MEQVEARIRELDAAVREHRREEKKHRMAGAEARAQLRELLEFCQAAGITVIIEQE